MTHVEQQLPLPTDGPHIHDLVCRDLMALDLPGAARASVALEGRKAVGVQRYGVALQAFNGRDAVRDAREEILDLLVYLRQAIEEGRDDLTELYREALRLACALVRASSIG